MSDNTAGISGDQIPDCTNVEPGREHAWLARFEGDWTISGNSPMPDGTVHEMKGTESVRMIGGIWFQAEGRGNMPGGGDALMIMTVGYDPARKLFVGSWVGSMMTHMWWYEGQLSEDGNSLHLEAEGPDFSGGSELKRYRDTIEYVTDDHRRLRSAMQDDEGKWNEFMVAEYHRVK